MKLILVRHGETEENKKHILQGLNPSKLSDDGRKQVEELGEKIKDKSVGVIYCSPVDRCKQTLEIILNKTNWKVPVIISDKIRERDFGKYVGKSHVELNMEELDQDNEENRKMGVEPQEEVNKRIKNFLNELKQNYGGKTVMVVSHSNPIRWIYANILGKTFEEILQTIKINNAEAIEFEI